MVSKPYLSIGKIICKVVCSKDTFGQEIMNICGMYPATCEAICKLSNPPEALGGAHDFDVDKIHSENFTHQLSHAVTKSSHR
jgi:hypothetical protein